MSFAEPFEPWSLSIPASLHRGGVFRTPRESSPLGIDGRRLEADAIPNGACPPRLSHGCRLYLSDNRVGTFLLTLPIAVRLAGLLSESTGRTFVLSYNGRFNDLTARLQCELDPVSECSDEHFIKVSSGGSADDLPRLTLRFSEIPTLDGHPLFPETRKPYLLNHISGVLWPDRDWCTVNASIPDRYCAYLSGIFRRKFEPASLRHFQSDLAFDPYHVVCVATTARPEFKDWGWRNFVELGKSLRHEQPDLRMTVVVSPGSPAVEADFGWLTVSAAPLPQCVDLFASASVVVGNDTGLTHLAALTRDRNGRSPNVVGLYNMHSFLKWSTGAVNHHALALPFSQMLAAADADVLLNQIKPELWGNITNLQNLPVDCVEAAVRMFLKDDVSPRRTPGRHVSA